MPAAQQLKIFTDNAQPGTLLSRLFVVPGVQLETAFDKHRASLFQILSGHLCLSRPQRYVDECGLFLFFAIFPGVNSVNGKAQFGNSGALRGVAHIRISGQISD